MPRCNPYPFRVRLPPKLSGCQTFNLAECAGLSEPVDRETLRAYPPSGQASTPKIELCRTIARNVDVHEERLFKVPNVGDEFFVDLAKYVCLRVDDSYAVSGSAAVVFVAKSAH